MSAAEEAKQKSPSAGAAGGGPSVPGAPVGAGRRVVVCDGVRGVFARRADGRWGLANGAELAVLEGLGGPSEAISRLRGLGAALEAAVAGPGDLVALGRCLRGLESSVEVYAARVPVYLVAAVTAACARWDHPRASDWLCWVLASRLEGNLSAGSGVGPGWLGWDIEYFDSPRRAWWNGCGWLEGLGDGFWGQLAHHRDERVRLAAEASDPGTSPARLAELAETPFSEVADLVCSHPRTPARTMKNLCRVPGENRFVWRTAQNNSADPSVLRWLANGQHRRWNLGAAEWRLLWLLALNANTPRDVLGRLSRGADSPVLSWVAGHPSAGQRTLERLARHNRWQVRRPVGWHPSASDRLIARLAEDKRREVRAAVAERRDLPDGVLDHLAGDRSLVVRASAAANPDLCERLVRRLAQDPHPGVRREIARRQDTPEDALVSLAADPDRGVRAALGENPSAPPEAVALLAGDTDNRVRTAVSYHPEAPVGAIRRFARSKDGWLRWGAAANPSTPPEVLEALADDSDTDVRDTAVRNPNQDQAVLERLAQHHDKFARHAVAENSAASDRLIARLAQDDCVVVFAAAAEALAERRAQNTAPTTARGAAA